MLRVLLRLLGSMRPGVFQEEVDDFVKERLGSLLNFAGSDLLLKLLCRRLSS